MVRSQHLRDAINGWFNTWDFLPNFYSAGLARFDDLFRLFSPARMFYYELYDVVRREADR